MGAATIPCCWGGDGQGQRRPGAHESGMDCLIRRKTHPIFSWLFQYHLDVKSCRRDLCRTAGTLQRLQSGVVRASWVAHTHCKHCMLHLISGCNSDYSHKLLHWDVTSWCTFTKMPGDYLFSRMGSKLTAPPHFPFLKVPVVGYYWMNVSLRRGRRRMWLNCFCLDGLTNCSWLHLTFGLFPFMHFWRFRFWAGSEHFW